MTIFSKIVSAIKTAVNWIAVDGLLHFLVSALFCLIFALFTPWWASLLLTLLIGVLKEIYDVSVSGWSSDSLKAAGHDLICDAVGIVIGTIIAVIYLYAL